MRWAMITGSVTGPVLHNDFFRAVQTERRAMFIILLLIVAVAVTQYSATLVMVVTDKRGDIAILKTQGLPNTLGNGPFWFWVAS